ncbi:uncharacterized protein LOC127429862 [Myxocyprinus asiaticus]|uniref:uncharacterized protein LOC127429862 n=1 Tax=Myxocyprinus asiaticus TaxID=70543 RepID=UPI002222EBD5|nr:uncharacterized protein LOC127429862 [Myxocyprinus asiaticus]
MIMNKQRKLSAFVLLCLLALIFPGSSRVWVLESSIQDLYRVGDNAVIYCKVDSDQERVEKCIFMWVILNSNDDETEDILHMKKYERRIRLYSFNETFISLTMRNLSIFDADNLRCIADCDVNGIFTRNMGDGFTLQISYKTEVQDVTQNKQTVSTDVETADFDGSKSSLTWISFLLLSINIMVFLTITVICASVMKMRMQRKC